MNDRRFRGRLLVLSVCFLALARPVLGRPPDVGPFPPLRFNPPEPAVHCLVPGTSVYVLADHEIPVFAVSVRIRGGSIFDPGDKVGLSEIFAQVLRNGGTRSRSSRELNRELEFMAASLEAGSEPEVMVITLWALSKDFERAMDIFEDVLLNPVFGAKELSLQKAKALESIRRRNDDPGSVAGRYFRKLFFGPHHPRGREMEVKTVQSVKRKDLLNLHRERFCQDRMVFSVSADVEESAVLSRLSSLLSRLPLSVRGLPSLPPVPHPSPETALVHKALDQSRVIMGQVGIPRLSKRHFAMDVAEYVIGGGGSSRLFSEIRSRRGLAYAVGSFSTEHAETGVVGVACQTKVSSTLEALRSMKSVLRDMDEKGPTAESVLFAKESLVNSHVFQFSSASQIADAYARLAYHGFPPDYLKTYPGNLMGVTNAQVWEIIRTYWNPDRMAVLIVGDESRFGETLDSLGPSKKIPLEP